MDVDIKCLHLSATNSYLLKAKEGYLLIDNGYDHDLPLFLKELQKYSVEFREISYLLLTHHHDDHSGLTSYIVEQNPNIKVIVHKLAVELLMSGQNETLMKNKDERNGIPTKMIRLLITVRRFFVHNWNLKFPAYNMRDKDIIVVSDNDVLLEQIGVGGRIIYTPGHTTDSISVLLNDGTCFCGDAAMSLLITRLAGSKYTTISIADLGEYYKSWVKMILAGAKIIYPSHGNSFPIERLKDNVWKIKILVPIPDSMLNNFKT
jgi:hydroxyacylglutathione hydrolase